MGSCLQGSHWLTAAEHQRWKMLPQGTPDMPKAASLQAPGTLSGLSPSVPSVSVGSICKRKLQVCMELDDK